jgi:hypothetical protein
VVFLLGFLRIAWPYLLGALILGVGYYKANHWCNAACQNATERAVEAEGTLDTVKKREAAIASLWADNVQKTETFTKREQVERNERFDALAGRAGLVARGTTVLLSVDASRVFRDATENANAARPTEVDQKPPDSISPATDHVLDVYNLSIYAVEAARAYADAYGHWQACVQFYEGLQHEQSQ